MQLGRKLNLSSKDYTWIDRNQWIRSKIDVLCSYSIGQVGVNAKERDVGGGHLSLINS